MQEQRQLLDILMGRNRNGEAPGAGKFTWTDHKVCRFFLAGLCPESLFTNTRHDLGGCRLVHSDELRAAYQREAPGKYEPELERRLRTLLEDSKRRISKAHERLQQAAHSSAPANALATAELEKLIAEITALHDEAERLGEEGKVDESKAAFDRAEALKVQQSRLIATTASCSAGITSGGDAQQQSLRVCETCGSYLSLLETDRGLMDHFSGKLHQGYRKIIDTYNALQDRKPPGQRRYYVAADDGAFVAERQQRQTSMATVPTKTTLTISTDVPLPTEQQQQQRARSRSKSPQRRDGSSFGADWRPTRDDRRHHRHDSDGGEEESDEGEERKHRHHHYESRSRRYCLHRNSDSGRHTAGDDAYSHFDGDHDHRDEY